MSFFDRYRHYIGVAFLVPLVTCILVGLATGIAGGETTPNVKAPLLAFTAGVLVSWSFLGAVVLRQGWVPCTNLAQALAALAATGSGWFWLVDALQTAQLTLLMQVSFIFALAAISAAALIWIAFMCVLFIRND